MSKPKKTELDQGKNTAILPDASTETPTDAVSPEASLQKPDAHDDLEEEFSALEQELKQRAEITELTPNEDKSSSPKTPVKIKMLKDFRIEYPLPCRRDTSMSMRLKINQEITDRYLIKHLSQNSNAPFIVIE